jgi:hypothetical protein
MCGRGIVGDDVKATGFGVEGRGRGQVARNGVGGPVKPQVAMRALHSPPWVAFVYENMVKKQEQGVGFSVNLK